jgi:hypothetical protein
MVLSIEHAVFYNDGGGGGACERVEITMLL